MNEIKDLPSLKLNDSEAKHVGKVKSSGVNVDEGLKWINQFISLNSLLVLQNFTTARKSGNILLTYLKALFVRYSSEYENVG